MSVDISVQPVSREFKMSCQGRIQKVTTRRCIIIPNGNLLQFYMPLYDHYLEIKIVCINIL